MLNTSSAVRLPWICKSHVPHAKHGACLAQFFFSLGKCTIFSDSATIRIPPTMILLGLMESWENLYKHLKVGSQAHSLMVAVPGNNECMTQGSRPSTLSVVFRIISLARPEVRSDIIETCSLVQVTPNTQYHSYTQRTHTPPGPQVSNRLRRHGYHILLQPLLSKNHWSPCR